jgi:hypothetical protein
MYASACWVCIPRCYTECRLFLFSLEQLSDQSPLAAFTVSPSTTFTSKAISISSEATTEQLALFASSSLASTSAASSSSNSSALPRRSRKTFVGLELDGECQLCCWTELENPDGTSVGEAIRVVKNVRSALALAMRCTGTDRYFCFFGLAHESSCSCQLFGDIYTSSRRERTCHAVGY